MIRVSKIKELYSDYNKENANLTKSNVTSEKEILSQVIKKFILGQMPQDTRQAHADKRLHLHDTDLHRPNCLNHDIEFILKEGLKALSCNSKPAKSLQVAINQILKGLSLGQAHMAGGQGIPLFNVKLAPYAHGLDYNEIKQAMQHFVYELNQINASRGFQTIFSNINCEYGIPNFLQNETVEYSPNKGNNYGDFEDESNMILSALCDVFNEKDADGKPLLFPNFITVIRDDIDKHDELLQKIIETNLETGNAYYLNMIKYGKKLAASMGCVDGKEVIIYKHKNELFVESFEEMWNKFEQCGIKTYGISEYIEVNDLEIYDSKNGFVKIKRIIRNPDKEDWVEIKLMNGRSLLATSDHPLPTKDGTVKRIDELTINDEIPVVLGYKLPETIEVDKDYAYRLGFLLCDVPNEVFSWTKKCKLEFLAGMIDANGYDVTNKKLIILLQSIGIPVNSECIISKELTTFIENKTIIDYTKIKEIKFIGKRDEYSYDVETESGYFDVSGIYSHNCRTYLDDTFTDDYTKDVLSTGNLEYVTINLPRIALKNITENVDIYDELQDLIKLAAKGLIARRRMTWELWDNDMLPFFKKYYDEENNRYYYNISHTTMSIGFVGLFEFGKMLNMDYNEQLEFIKEFRKMIDELKDYSYKELADKLQVEYKEHDELSRWSLIASPAESTAYTTKQKDNELYGNILNQYDLYDKLYYTNSFHVPEYKQTTCIEKINYEAPFHKYCNAGSISHIWSNELDADNKTLADFVIDVCKNTDTRYFTFSPCVIYCNNCKSTYIGDPNTKICKNCKSPDIEYYEKITGYISSTKNWNPGKKAEFNNRYHVNKI